MRALNTRLNRAWYWLCLIVLAALYTALSVFGEKHAAVSEVVLLFLCVPRLHDIGLSGWWFAAAFGLEIAVVAASLILLPLSHALIPMGLFVLFAFIAMTWLGIRPGEPGTNRFGDAPPPGLSFKRTTQAG
jgi:uncharacterized membrane protein YhaH (DUF805 family)